MYGNGRLFKGWIGGFTMGTSSTLALLPPENMALAWTVCPRTAGRWLRFRKDTPEVLEELEPLPPGPIPLQRDDDIRRAA
jgi:hypothetical protein